MIRKTLVWCSLLLILYALFIHFWDYEVYSDQHQWNKNKIKAEEYIFDEQDLSTQEIIVGTSLSGRIIMEMLPPTFSNLSFSGLSIYDGLTIISHTSTKPKVIYIETNLLLNRSVNRSLHDDLFSPYGHFLKTHIPVLREKNEPVGMMKSFLVNVSVGFRKAKERTPKAAKNIFIPKKKTKINKRALERHRQNKSKPPNKLVLDAAILHLKSIIDTLDSQGSKVILFEMPIEAALCDLIQPITIRKTLKELLPPSDYTYLPLPNCDDFQTTDGYHLDRKGGVDYTSYFISNRIQ